MFKELWLSFIYIQQCQVQHSSSGGVVSASSETIEFESLENTFSLCLTMFPVDVQITFLSSKFYANNNQTDKAINLIENFAQKLYFNDISSSSSRSSTTNVEASILFEHFLGLKEINSAQLGFQKSSSSSNESLLYQQLNSIFEEKRSNSKSIIEFVSNLFNMSILYCYYMNLKGTSHFSIQYICNVYEKLIKKFKVINYRSILWIRYFKFISCCQSSLPNEESSYSDKILKLTSKAIHDLSEVAQSACIVIPFNYLPSLKQNSLLFNHNFYDSNNFKSKSLISFYYCHSNIDDCNIEENVFANSNSKETIDKHHKKTTTHLEMDYFYHNCLIDTLFKLYARNLSDKCLLAKHLSELMPHNTGLIKMLVNFSKKFDGTQKTLQFLYDHLCVHSVFDEQLVSVK
jgi:hypothetical protein